MFMVDMRYAIGMAAAAVCVAVLMGTGPAARQQRNTDSGSQDPALVDLTSAVVVTPAELNLQQRTAIRVLVEEVEKRTAIRLRVSAQWPAETVPAIAVGPLSTASTWAAAGLKGLPSAAAPGKEG
jgi:hypothetical protein